MVFFKDGFIRDAFCCVNYECDFETLREPTADCSPSLSDFYTLGPYPKEAYYKIVETHAS
jgi:hypothetical protein